MCWAAPKHSTCTTTLPLDTMLQTSLVGVVEHHHGQLHVAGSRQRELGQNVSQHVLSRAPGQRNGSILDQVTHKVKTDVDVLGLVGGHCIGGQGNTSLVVLHHLGGLRELHSKALQ